MIYIGLWQAGSRLWSSTNLDNVSKAIQKAIELGLTYFDTAEIYGWGRSERLLGNIVKELKDVFIVSKVGGFRWTENDIAKAASRIRGRLGRDSIDLLLSHWPPPFYADICRIIHGLEKAIDQGYASNIGLSNYPSNLLEKAVQCTRKYKIKTNQIQYSLAYRTPELNIIQETKKLNIKIMAWSPLAKGALATSRVTREPARMSDPVFRRALKDKNLHNALEDISRQLGLTKAQVAVSWINIKGIDPVVGIRKPEHVEDLAKIKDYTLPEWAVRKLDQVSMQYINAWGTRYKVLGKMRYIPGLLQHLSIRVLGGV
ncbi:MAG: aldo/keto reductase [Desulfurococcales archaeon]|nr:aldo/keto reductase [Desulfurococcales archaeon]